MKKKNKKINSDEDLKLMTGMFALECKGMPETTCEMVNFYGTYEIQPTAETDNQYPAIAQGYNPKMKTRDCENPIPPKYPTKNN